ncbi:CPBP family intramembrane glutamic endopeptidase [Marinicella meishanensis]|uniref:CPBP family intramembrane glutamic endopeptidase n=1 Tax=Marinicella meishanensis TaxID=2873263 RepID=UPI001CBA91CA|nr:CPBP family intramembrane glutamic endopeptidase [Marinicella sp. NBU2979]
MLGLLVILLISWLLLHVASANNLGVLGLWPTPNKLWQFVLGWLLLVVLTGLSVLSDTWFFQIDWALAQRDPHLLAQGFGYFLKSALTEDLMFRGALLFLLIQWWGPSKAMLISAVAFGIYHWFSYGLLTEEIKVIPLLYVFLLTGLMGWAWAYAFHQTRTMMMPLGMHVGSNFTLSLFFHNQPYGELLFHQVARTEPNEWLTLGYLLAKAVLIPWLVFIIVRHFYQQAEAT